MKVHITENIDRVLDGYQIVPILYGKVDLAMMPDNSAQSIVAVDALDSIPANLIGEFFQKVASKMRFGCTLILGGTELSILSKDVLNGNISSNDYNNAVYNKRGLYTVIDILNILSEINLKIDSVIIRGHEYEIKASRPLPSN